MPVALWPSGQRGIRAEPHRVLGTVCERRGSISAFRRRLTYPEVNQVPVRCWVGSESLPVFWPERE